VPAEIGWPHVKIAIRNVGGAFYPSNPYRNAATQTASWATLLATGADILMLQEATGVGKPLTMPDGWRASPASALDRGAGSVVAAASQVDGDLEWRPSHPVIDAFGAYLDFGLLRAYDEEIAFVSVHATSWRPEVWAAAGHTTPSPTGLERPWPSDLLLDTLLTVVSGRQAILAGDWNEAPNYPMEGDQGTMEWFDRARRAGLIEVLSLAFGGPVRTNFARSTKHSYQNDHVFMTGSIAKRVRSVAVWNEPHATLSDHAGIVVTLE
jgi:hypothetical protein